MNGDPVEFEFVSLDATTAAEIVLREPGNPLVRTLAEGERLVIQQLNWCYLGGAAAIVDLFTDANGSGTLDAGELIARVGNGANHINFMGTGEGVACARGILPKVIASGTGNVSIAGVGVIVNS